MHRFWLMLIVFLALMPVSSYGASSPDTGNTSWLMVSAALVMLMTPGLAFFYAGMVSRKNVVSTLLQNFIVLAIVGLIWVAVGYSLVFTEYHHLIGGFDLTFLNGLEETYYGDTGVPSLAFAAFQMMFAIIAPAIITGAIAERVHFRAWLIIMTLWSLLVYIPVAHWVWGPGGWLAVHGGLDFAGGLVVHITAGFSGLVAASMFGKRIYGHHSIPNDIPMIILGAALLWFGWFGFNAGSAITAGVLASYAFINTFVAAAIALLCWLATDAMKKDKPTALGSAISVIVGLVAITPAAGFVTIESAMLIGAIASVLCNLIIRFLKAYTHLDDSLDVFACHGIGGVIGAVMTGLLASKAVNPSIAHEGWFISGETSLIISNLYGVVIVAAFSLVATFVIIKFVNLFTPIRVGADAEERGLDASLHGEMARYDRALHGEFTR